MKTVKKYVIVECGMPVFRDDRGHLNTNGTLGVITEDNVYIRTYPAIDPGHPPPKDLGLFERTQATYRLSGSKGTYNIVRVE